MLTAHARFWRRSLSRAYSVIAMENPVLEAPVHRGMQQLDRSAFNQQLTLLAARLPATKTTQFMHKDAKESVWTSVLAAASRRRVSKLTSDLFFHATQLRPAVTRNRPCQPGPVRTAPESLAPNRGQMYVRAARKGDGAKPYPDVQNPLLQPRCRQNSSNWSTGAAERSSSTRSNSTMTFGLQVGSPLPYESGSLDG